MIPLGRYNGMIFPEDRMTEGGSVRIHNDVVAIIAGIAASEVEGIAGMGGGFSLAEVFGQKTMKKGVLVEIGQGEAAIDMFVVVEYGRNIPEIAMEVQRVVKKKVEAMTGLTVIEVNVIVDGVQVPSRPVDKPLESEDDESGIPIKY